MRKIWNVLELFFFFFSQIQLNKNVLVKVLDKQQLCQQDRATHFPGKPALV